MFLLCTAVAYDIIQMHMHFDNSTLNGHGIGVTPTSFTQVTGPGGLRKKNALGYGRVIYTQSLFIFV